MNLLLIWHAPAIRPSGLIYGSTNYRADISLAGQQSALARELESCGKWVSSELERALQTANAMSAVTSFIGEIIALPAFNEQNFGELEGSTRSKGHIGPSYWLFSRDFIPPGGESFDELCIRSFEGVRNICAGASDEDVAIFTHGNVIRSVLAQVLDLAGDTPSRISIRNWAFVKFHWSGARLDLIF